MWFRDHADHHMAVLLDPDSGPFKHCTPDKGHSPRMEPLPLEEPPEGMFALTFRLTPMSRPGGLGK